MSDLNRFDLEKAQKQVRSLTRLPEGRVALETELGIKFAYSDKNDNKPCVAILIPSHKTPANETGMALNAMVAEAKNVAHIVVPPSVASSVVHWVRNQCLVNLNKTKTPYTHVCFMDDDMVPSPETLRVLIERNVDVIGAVCTVRQDPPLPNVRVFNEKTFTFMTADIDKPGVYKGVGAVGTGLLLVTKKALDDIAEYTMSCQYQKKYFEWPDHVVKRVSEGRRKKYADTGDAFWFRFLEQINGDGEFGEDVSLCLKARECGYEIYADATTKVGHIGNYGFSLEDYWSYRNDAINQGKVVSIEGGEMKHTRPEDEIVVVD